MKILRGIKLVLKNKVMLYMLTRYVTYGMSFFVSMYAANRMGPYYYGIWGYLILLLNYFNLINFGIPQAAQVLQIQNRENLSRRDAFEKSGFVLTGVLGVGVICFALYERIVGIAFFEKYELGNLFYWICLCGIINYFNLYYSKVYRVKNKLLEIAFHQTFVVLLTFVVVFWKEGYPLLQWMLGAYVIAYFVIFLFYSFRGGITLKGEFRFYDCKKIINKGFFLFLYNSGFYFIMISTKTIVSINYTVTEFGYFTFAYLLGHAVLQLLEAFSYLISAKLLNRYRSSDTEVVSSTIRLIRVNYVALFHGIMYLAMIVFPVFIRFVPKYEGTLLMINLACLTMLLFTNSFGYSTFLMARNKERVLAFIAIFSLGINVLLGVFCVNVLQVNYQYTILPTLLTYFIYAYLCVYYGRKELKLNRSIMNVFKDCFPLRLLLPFIVAVIIILCNITYLLCIPFVVYIALNGTTIKEIFHSFKRIFYKPEIVDL